MIKGFAPWIRAKTNSKSEREEKEREAGKIKRGVSSIARLRESCGYWSGADGCDSVLEAGFFSDTLCEFITTHFLLIKFALHYAEYFKQRFPEGLFLVGSSFRNKHSLGKALLP